MSSHKSISWFLAPLLACGLAGIVVPRPAIAQSVPSYASLPSYASREETIHGRIASIDGQYRITVRDDNGYLDHVALRQGTVINPTGLTLAPGMSVTILGYNGGSVFQANEIDTPYTYAGPRPAAASYSVGVAYPGFAFSYAYGSPVWGWGYPGFAYAYGPSYGIFFAGGYRGYYPYGYGRYRGYYPYGYGRYRGYYPYGYAWPYRGYGPYPYRWAAPVRSRSYVGHPYVGYR